MTEATALTDLELDAYLAEHLFGVRDPIVTVNEQPIRVAQPGDAARVFGYFSGYSSTGDGILLVIEAMRERGWWLSVEEYGDDGPHQCVEFDKDDANYLPLPVRAVPGRLPRAVAEAAAAAIQAEEAGA